MITLRVACVTLLGSWPACLAGQVHSVLGGDGWAYYEVSVPSPLPSELVYRDVWLNTGRDPLTPRSDLRPCAVIRPEVTLRESEKTCSDEVFPLQPGDSIWAEIKGLPLVDGRAPQVEEVALRTPFVLEVINESERTDLSFQEITHVVLLSFSRHGGGRVVAFPVDVVAGGRMGDMAPFFAITVRVDSDGRYELRGCWRGSRGEALYSGCERVRDAGASAMMFGLKLSRLIEVELSRRFARSRR